MIPIKAFQTNRTEWTGEAASRLKELSRARNYIHYDRRVVNCRPVTGSPVSSMLSVSVKSDHSAKPSCQTISKSPVRRPSPTWYLQATPIAPLRGIPHLLSISCVFLLKFQFYQSFCQFTVRYPFFCLSTNIKISTGRYHYRLHSDDLSSST